MRERGVGQQVLARQCGLSQGHLSKVLRLLTMGQRTRDRLQKWLDFPDDSERVEVMGADDLVRLGAMLKRHCEELAHLSRRARLEVNTVNTVKGGTLA